MIQLYTAEMREMRRFWREGIAQNAVFFHSFVASPAWKVSSSLLQTGVAEDWLPKTSPKLAPRCGASVGALFEVQFRKICSKLWRRAVWKSKSSKHQDLGPLFEVQTVSNCCSRGRQGFRRSIHMKIAV